MAEGPGNCKLTCEHIIDALDKNKGFVFAAKRYIKKTYGYDVGYNTIKKRIKEWGMEDWLYDMRKTLVEDCLQKTFAKSIADGDNSSIMWVLDRYGHHLDFLDSADTDTQSKKGWKELLDYIKADTQSNPEKKPSGEHSET
jgi:hypothetical protein